MGHWLRYPTVLVIAIIVCFQINQSVGFLDDEDDNVARGDRYIDEILEDMLEQNRHDFEPYVLEDSQVGFSKKIAFVNVSGEAKLHNGYITGLSSLHRPDHCSVEEEGEKLLVKADLGAGVLDFYYDGTVKFMNFGPTITVHGVLSYLEVHMEFTVNAKTGRQGKLTKFVIDEMKGLKVSISGLGPMNWAMNYIMKGVTSIFQGFLKKFMQNRVEKHIADRIQYYQFPIEGGDIDVIPETTEAPEEITEAPEEIPEETEAPEEIPEETEAPEEIPEETEAPEEIPDETEAPEEILEETEAPEEIPEETEAPEEIPEETEAPEEIPEETEAPEEIPEEEEVLEALQLFKALELI